MKKWIVGIVLALLVVGCVTSTDPETGEKLYGLDPNTVGGVESLVDTGLALGSIAFRYHGFPVFVFLMRRLLLRG
ncbi:unnamed protein product [marine sediment metagenome]|uniref:Lipoprotein n=1 Tax=marine sediment metagenome TaxID=412755 RepID=X1S5H2_9ZZZZ